ncbi:MAG: DUF692 domain-containing protein [Beijerinckiaceae bacterium]|nr:DUF692 domain-containing protein [Beijerinckiaceae bacterium]
MTLQNPATANPVCQSTPARTWAGVGFKPQHFQDIMENAGCVRFLEVHAENYMGAGGMPHRQLTLLRERFDLSVHGVGLSIGGLALDDIHLDRLHKLVRRYQPRWVSEHLAWSTHDGVFFNDLLPLAYDNAALTRVVSHLGRVQDRLGRQILLENPSTYVAFESSTWDEVDFIREVTHRAGCDLLLDINNVQVSCVNHSRDPLVYLNAFPLERVREIHLGGYATDDVPGEPLLIDAHDRPVQPDVWRLYAHALKIGGPVSTLIEWDNDVPDAHTLFEEAAKADALLADVINERSAA